MKIECPIDDYRCPYYNAGNCCMREMEGADPTRECDAFFDIEGWEEDYEMGFDPYLGCYTDDC